MKSPLFAIAVLLAFGWSFGYYAYRVCFDDSPRAYVIAGDSQWMSYPSAKGEHPHLYLRKSWSIHQRPIAAWIELVGQDELSLFVNGRRAHGRVRRGTRRTAGLLLDITNLLKPGLNSVAIHVKQTTIGRRPRVSVRGEYTQADGTRHILRSSDGWKANHFYDRRGNLWFHDQFPDDHWVEPELSRTQWIGTTVSEPPRALNTVFDAPWVVADSTGAEVAMSRKFEVEGRPRSAWLRVLTMSPTRLALNGEVIDDDTESLALPVPYRTRQRIYDVSDLVQPGTNVLSTLSQPGELPRLKADLEVETWDAARWSGEAGEEPAERDRTSGQRLLVESDERWKWRASPGAEWTSWETENSEWSAVTVDRSYARIPPWMPVREVRETVNQGRFTPSRIKQLALCISLATVIGWIGCWFTHRVANYVAGAGARISPHLVRLSLLPSALVGLFAALIDHDPSFEHLDIFSPAFLKLSVVVVVAIWFLIVFLAAAFSALPRGDSMGRADSGWGSALVSLLVLLCIFAAGLGLRMEKLLAEPIHHDEVGAYAFTVGVLKHGIPSGQAHDDLRYGIAATSELVYYPMALAALFFDHPLEVIRAPAVVFSMLTVLLAYYVGSRLFSRFAGLLAATFVAFSPYLVGMATFGRYFSQLQMLTLLSVYLTYRAVVKTNGVHVGYLWAATGSFICMYLSWEGSGLIGLPLAVAVLWHRRRHLKSLLCSPHLYAGSFLVLSAVLYQNGHRTLQQTQRMWYGTGISALQVKPMWRYPLFDLEYYLVESSWIRASIVPASLLFLGVMLAIKHPYKRKLQFFLIVLVGTALLMGIALPLRSGRYSYHLVALAILVCAGSGGAICDWMIATARGARIPIWCQVFAGAMASLLLVALGVMGSGQLIRPVFENPMLRTLAFDVDQLRYPNWDGPMRYLRKEMRPGDIVISHMPHAAEFTMHQLAGGTADTLEDRWRVDYWLQSALILQSSLGDSELAPRDRRSGAKMIANLDQLKRVFADNDRVWYLTSRYGQSRINDNEVSDYIRHNMDVTFEDFVTAVMLRDATNRPAEVQFQDDQLGEDAREFFVK